MFFAFGLIYGSFFNVLADRLPAGQNILKPPSHCFGCNRRLNWTDLIPVVSFVMLKGRCRYCGSKIPLRIPLLELATGLIFLGSYLYFGLNPDLAIALFYFSILLVIFVIDLEHQLILNVLVYPAAVAAVIISLLASGYEPVPSIGSALIGAGAGLVLFLIIAIVSRGGMGFGDVKMAGLMGLMLGFPVNLVAIFIAVVSGGLVALAALVLKRKDRRQAIAFGPFLALGTMAAFLWGASILDWYLGYFS